MSTRNGKPDKDPTPKGGADDPKVERFGWTIIDTRGRYQLIPKEELNVDHDYQRKTISQTRVLMIAQAWSWVACAVLIVARRADGTLWVVDGQHRKIAADKRTDIDRLPCLVFDVAEKVGEARGFISLNAHRGPVRAFDMFNALFTSGDEGALTVKRMVEASGYKIADDRRSQDAHTVRCVGTLLRLVRSNYTDAQTAWDLCVEIYDGEQIQDDILATLHYLQGFLRRRRAGSLTDPNNRSALLGLSPTVIKKTIDAGKAVGGGGTKAGADGLVQLLNKKRRSKKLPRPYTEDETDAD